MTSRAYIGLGSNQGDPAGNVESAIGRLAGLGAVARRSRLYRTAPWGVTDQPEFVNAVAALDTDMDPRALLAALKEIETDLGRTPTYRWGPRVIDLDILTYGAERLDEPDLIVPHPRLRERAFVLVPLAEIDPAYAALRDALPERELRDVTLRA
ncbi:MAG TPA: 2-amino-4-hydroxy-6-hydroxymethyldihydropteridine diphosphokinase [Candidatus Acidoferrales bacterium]|nr:2-amino-4-hydroxy-6-hydroxymethyldihydropteridine diphosphokinase [Candidatus Acidoferrales bacterium]